MTMMPDPPGWHEKPTSPRKQKAGGTIALVLVLLALASFLGFATGLSATRSVAPTPFEYALDENRPTCVRFISGVYDEQGTYGAAYVKASAIRNGIVGVVVKVVPASAGMEYVIVSGWRCREKGA